MNRAVLAFLCSLACACRLCHQTPLQHQTLCFPCAALPLCLGWNLGPLTSVADLGKADVLPRTIFWYKKHLLAGIGVLMLSLSIWDLISTQMIFFNLWSPLSRLLELLKQMKAPVVPSPCWVSSQVWGQCSIAEPRGSRPALPGVTIVTVIKGLSSSSWKKMSWPGFCTVVET